MATGKRRDAGTERYWRRMLRQWRSSGLGVRAFCRLHEIREASFYRWRRMLAERDVLSPAFVPVQVVAEPVVAGQQSASGLELVLDGGRVVRIGPAFDAPTLQRLLALLEEGQP